MLPFAPRPSERLAEVTERAGQARQVEREIAALERSVRSEHQFNRKVELRQTLRYRIDELTALTDPTPPTEDTRWTG